MQTNSAKFAFWYMLSLVSLISVAIAMGNIIFEMINKFIADDVIIYSGVYNDQSMKFSIATLLIAAPIFYFVSRLIHRSLFAGELENESQIRKWLSYLVLFISSVTMIGWFIGLINDFLNGELTLKFGLKALMAILIAGTVFSFYFYDIRRKDIVNKKDRVVAIYFYTTLFLVLAIFTSSFFVIDSPYQTRNRRADEMIMSNFDIISSSIDQYYNDNNSKLPANFDELMGKIVYLREENLHNAQNERYEYKIVDKMTYQLCAEFKTSNKELPKGESMPYGRWIHDSGYQCLSQKVNEDQK